MNLEAGDKQQCLSSDARLRRKVRLGPESFKLRVIRFHTLIYRLGRSAYVVRSTDAVDVYPANPAIWINGSLKVRRSSAHCMSVG